MTHRKWSKVRIIADGDKLKRARIERGISGVGFAHLIGMSRQQVYAIEKGTSGVSETSAMRIAKTLGIPFSELFEFVWPDVESMEKSIKQGEKANRRYQSALNHNAR